MQESVPLPFGLPVTTASRAIRKAPAGSMVPWFLLQNQACGSTLLEAGLSSSQYDSTQQKTQ